MRVRLHELKNVIRRVIAENGIMREDIDDILGYEDEDDMPANVNEDEIEVALRAAYAETGDIDEAIGQVYELFPTAPMGLIDSLADIVVEFDDEEHMTGPSSFRPSLVNQNIDKIKTGGMYN